MFCRTVVWCTAVVSTLMLAACGGARRREISSRAGPPARTIASSTRQSQSRLLVFFKRVAGVDPLASQLTVTQDGGAVALITFGGINGERRQSFAMPPSQLTHLRRLLRQTPLGDTACCSARSYIYFISYSGHSWRLQQGLVPHSMQALIDDLDAITNVHTDS